MSIFKVDYMVVPLFFLFLHSLAPKIEICLQYFLDKKFQKQPLCYSYQPALQSCASAAASAYIARTYISSCITGKTALAVLTQWQFFSKTVPKFLNLRCTYEIIQTRSVFHLFVTIFITDFKRLTVSQIVKFMFSEKATKFEKISQFYLKLLINVS